MKKLLFIFISIGCIYGLTRAFYMSSVQELSQPSLTSIQCLDGEVIGLEDFTDHLRDVSESCQYLVPNMNLYFNCILKTVGSVNQDGKPDMESLNRFYVNLFAKTFYDNIPGLRKGLEQCAEIYVSAYNRMTQEEAEASDLAEKFVFCFIDETEKFIEHGDGVCEME